MHELTVVTARIPAVSVSMQVAWACTLEHVIIVLVQLFPKVLQTRVLLSDWTIVKTEVDLASLGERETWRVLISVHVILSGNIKSVYKTMLPGADLI
jgi:hypothetical protein